MGKQQLSDRKYKSLMKMIDVALPNFDDGKDAEKATARAPAPVVRHTSFARSRARAADEEEDDELKVHEETTDDESDDPSDDDGDGDGEKEKFYDTPDIADGVSVSFLQPLPPC